MMKSKYLEKLKYKNVTNIKNIINNSIDKIYTIISDERIKNPNTFEYQAINELFSDKVIIRSNVSKFLDDKKIHEVIRENFYFSNILLNLFRKRFRKEDVAIIMTFDFGRTGNRFNELQSFIQFGLSLELNNIFLDSDDPMFNLEDNEYVLPLSKITSNSIKIKCKNAIFFHHLIWDLEIHNYQRNEKQAKNILSKIFITNRINNLDNKDMVVHIRGGDIFDSLNPPNNRHQPPFSWYI